MSWQLKSLWRICFLQRTSLLSVSPPPPRSCSQPAIVAVNAALKERAAEIDGKVKVTAYDCSAAAKAAPQAIGTCDLLVFPACLRIARVPLEQAGAVAAAALVRNAAATLADGQERLTGPTFLVCCHRSRDARCGALGPPLVAALSALGAEVYLSSHVGGHKWAGNVIVYGIDHPAHGHWFGGLTARDAAAFAAALAALQPGDDPAGHPQLRAWWRGRSGMTKAEQMQHFKRCAQTGDIEDVAGKS